MDENNHSIDCELFLICLKRKPKWIAMMDTHTINIDSFSCVNNFCNLIWDLRQLVSLCVPVDTDNIVRNTPFANYGNCIICHKKGLRNKRCGRNFCRSTKFAWIMIFTNLQGYYINPDLIEMVLKDDKGGVDVNEEELLYEEDITSVDVCLPLDCNEYIS